LGNAAVQDAGDESDGNEFRRFDVLTSRIVKLPKAAIDNARDEEAS
jgi:hypothetical protein